MVPLQNISKGAITMDYAYSTTMEAVQLHFTTNRQFFYLASTAVWQSFAQM